MEIQTRHASPTPSARPVNAGARRNTSALLRLCGCMDELGGKLRVRKALKTAQPWNSGILQFSFPRQQINLPQQNGTAWPAARINCLTSAPTFGMQSTLAPRQLYKSAAMHRSFSINWRRRKKLASYLMERRISPFLLPGPSASPANPTHARMA